MRAVPKKWIWVPALILIGGLALVLTAVFAEQLGIDPSAGWGRGRIALLFCGLLAMAIGALAWIAPSQSSALWRRLAPAIEKFGSHPTVAEWMRASRTYWLALPISAFVILVYVWLVSAGTWSTWTSPTAYYVDLARGFQRGHLYMDIKVPPGLLTSPDPYTPLPNGQTQGPTDLSYYNGKLYLPWGPAPALVVLLFRWLFHWWLGDMQLTFIFLCGLFLAESALLLFIWDRFFRLCPRGLLWLSILLVGLAGPGPFMLSGHFAARIYEAAVAGGQFFEISGLMLAILSVQRRLLVPGLAFSAFLWALAIGSRPDLTLPIGLLMIVVIAWFLARTNWSFKGLASLAPMFIILGIAGACWAWYNWARFGSVTETGYYYQLAGVSLQQHWNERFSAIYLVPNVYSYLLNPPHVSTTFPFLISGGGSTGTNPSVNVLYGRFYFTQLITGVLWLIPFAIFAFVPLVSLTTSVSRHGGATPPEVPEKQQFLNWLTLSLVGSILANLLFLFLYFWAAMRFSEEFVPLMMLLSAVGFWQGYEALARYTAWRRIYTALAIALAVVSISVSLLVGLASNDGRLVLISLFAR